MLQPVTAARCIGLQIYKHLIVLRLHRCLAYHAVALIQLSATQ